MILGLHRYTVAVSVAVALAACGGGGGAGTGEGTPPPSMPPSMPPGPPDVTPPSVTLGNAHHLRILHSGFLIGTAGDDRGIARVDIKIDNGAFQPAFVDLPNGPSFPWKFQLPNGAATWKDNSVHMIAVRATDTAGNETLSNTVTVRKGNNQDINGDGYPDILAGASFEGARGEAYVFLSQGSAGVASAGVDLANTTLFGDNQGLVAAFGWAVALGDVNGDGFADAVVGAVGAGGQVYVFHSRGATGIPSAMANANNATSTVLTGEQDLSQFGTSIATGDVNGDGFADVIVGASRFNNDTGRVYVFHSKGPAGVTSTVAGQNAADTNTMLTGEATDTDFGTVVAAGDVTGDGHADVVVGAVAHNNLQGRVFVFHSRGNAGIASTIAAPNTADTHTTLTGEAVGDRFGETVALGDVNGDGNADIVVGAERNQASTGRVYVFQSQGAAGVTSTDTPALDAHTVLTGEPGTTRFGSTVAVGDVSGDGHADMAVRATGTVYLFHSKGAAGVTSTVAASDATDTNAILSDGLGTALAMVDVNADGYPDLATGGVPERVYVFHAVGEAGIPSTDTPEAAANTILTGTGADLDFFGGSLAQ